MCSSDHSCRSVNRMVLPRSVDCSRFQASLLKDQEMAGNSFASGSTNALNRSFICRPRKMAATRLRVPVIDGFLPLLLAQE